MSFFGKNIRKIRSVKTLSQQAFAELFNLKRGTLGAYEEGRSEPKIETIIKIANYFSIPIDDLLKRELTVNELLKFKSSLSEQHDLSNPETFKQIPCITEKNTTDYISNYQNRSFVQDMVQVTLPVDSSETMRAFVVTNLEMTNQNQGLFPKDVVLGTFVKKDKYKNIEHGSIVLVLTKDQLILRKAYVINNTLVLKAEHQNIDELNFVLSEINEIWKITSVYQRRITAISSGIEDKLSMLEKEFAKLRSQI
ncbi:helix-turn-helix domain-containing protein [Leeuwenhoekiella marinoflava]|uniref:DNA-binding XRE family transcriptional regulator n=2 Tax=Leeuwenhoekiella marinoflava TaxID=988 RepID=A0A4V1KSR6_9FLAO|nr:helix-turn-helix transcriptional regulator [Leeuwenhoekiella marinoflava]RXG32668.1 DNA-binding XRE family transcriptional regulator [Leeuwenhoekiella marinoflava]SHE52761.1 DNA-binding transcriptional regulator, XRE-family HTH domain [Leeuwenhoekiella marinoflava DSM 3653]